MSRKKRFNFASSSFQCKASLHDRSYLQVLTIRQTVNFFPPAPLTATYSLRMSTLLRVRTRPSPTSPNTLFSLWTCHFTMHFSRQQQKDNSSGQVPPNNYQGCIERAFQELLWMRAHLCQSNNALPGILLFWSQPQPNTVPVSKFSPCSRIWAPLRPRQVHPLW